MHLARDFTLVIDAQLILAILARLASAIGFRRIEQRDAPPHGVIGFLRNLPPESRAAQPDAARADSRFAQGTLSNPPQATESRSSGFTVSGRFSKASRDKAGTTEAFPSLASTIS